MERIHHAALFTSDYETTARFYREVFDAEAPPSCEQPSAIHLGGIVLHVFEHSAVRGDAARAHLHHLGLLSSGLEEFDAIRRRLVERHASDGVVEDFGAHLSVLAKDPDGGMLEVMLDNRADRGPLPFAVQAHR